MRFITNTELEFISGGSANSNPTMETNEPTEPSNDGTFVVPTAPEPILIVCQPVPQPITDSEPAIPSMPSVPLPICPQVPSYSW